MDVIEGTRRLKHWGWGYEDQQPPHDEVEAAARGLREHLGFGSAEVEGPVPLDDVTLRPPRLDPPEALAAICSSGAHVRASHALGKAYRDVVRGFRGDFPEPPDVVARPQAEADVERVLDWCEAAGAAVVPFGGGTSVCGGVEARDLGDRPVVTLDLRALDRVLEVDATSQTALIQAGATGPELEEQLRSHGLTLRHFPQSFEYSTLGGWIATRAGGHFATGPTHIDDLVQSVRAITPAGEWQSRRLPASGAGPSPDRMLIGSEGILGVITEAWVRVRPRPPFRAAADLEFETFEAGARAVRDLAQSGLSPSNCRLLDPAEAELTGASAAGRAVLVLGFESAGPSPRRLACARAGALRRSRGQPQRRAAPARARGGGERAWRRRGLVARRVPARALPARHHGCCRCPGRDVRDGDHLGRVR